MKKLDYEDFRNRLFELPSEHPEGIDEVDGDYIHWWSVTACVDEKGNLQNSCESDAKFRISKVFNFWESDISYYDTMEELLQNIDFISIECEAIRELYDTYVEMVDQYNLLEEENNYGE